MRPQLLDRFGFNVALSGQTLPAERGQIIRRRLDFDSDPVAFCTQWAEPQAALRERCTQARARLDSIALDDQALAQITERCFAAGVDGLRADLVWLRGARPMRRGAALMKLPRRILKPWPSLPCATVARNSRRPPVRRLKASRPSPARLRRVKASGVTCPRRRCPPAHVAKYPSWPKKP